MQLSLFYPLLIIKLIFQKDKDALSHGPSEIFTVFGGRILYNKTEVSPKNNLNPISQMLEFIVLYWKKEFVYDRC